MFHIGWAQGILELLGWCSLHVLVLLAVSLARQRLYRELPFFFSYVSVTALSTLVRLVAYISKEFLFPPNSYLYVKLYGYVYWVSSLAMSMFAILAIYEIFIKRLFVGFYKIRFYRYLFPAAVLTILLLAVLTAVFSPDQTFKLADRVLVFIRLISLGFFTLLMIVMGRAWTRYELAIVFSFGIIAATNFFTSVMWGQNPKTDKYSLVSYLPIIAWNIACVIWLIAFGKPEKPQQGEPPKPISPEVLQEAKKWEGTLKNWLTTPKKKQR